MSAENVSTASSTIKVKVKGFRFFPMRVILEIEKEVSDEKKSIRVLRKNDTYDYTLVVKAEVHND